MVDFVLNYFVYLCILTMSSHWYEKKVDEASPSIILAGRALLVKMPITLKLHGIFGSNFVYLSILTLSSHCYEKSDEAAPSIIFVGRPLLVKVLITLEPHGMWVQTLYTYVF